MVVGVSLAVGFTVCIGIRVQYFTPGPDFIELLKQKTTAFTFSA